MKYPVITLHSGRDQSISRRHQWIFSKAIKQKDPSIGDGDLVSICNTHGSIIATGHYQDSSLCIRILEFGDVVIDAELWRRKLLGAYQYRVALGLIGSTQTNAYRLVHGEGDELPGLIIDVYDRIAVLQAHSHGMHRQRHEIAAALMTLDVLQLSGVYDKSSDLNQHADSGNENRWLAGTGTNPVRISENGIVFLVDYIQGQKTGFFLDQRENRQLINTFASGKEILNCFCYTGGFSLYALTGAATHVTSIDSSSLAMEMLEQNLLLNQLGSHNSRCTNVMEYLNHTSDMYDLIICDPPAFAKNLHKRHNAIQAYKRLNAMAMRHVRPGGMLFTFSCSQVVDRQLFYNTIVAAAIEAERPMRVICEMSQGADHPVSVFHPEGSYLKGLALYLD